MCVLFVFQKNRNGNIVLEHGFRETFGVKIEGVAGG